MSTVHSRQRCYLDHAAATPMLPEVAEAMQDAAAVYGNPSSPHASGREARHLLEAARERIIAALGGSCSGPRRDRLLFTSGGTEANQMAIAGLSTSGDTPAPLLHSARDHAGTVAAARQLAAAGRRVIELPLDAQGLLERSHLSDASEGVLSTTLACSQTGTLEDVAALAAASPQLLIHVDAVQAVGRVPVKPSAMAAASLALAAHKLGGPRGVGGLFLREATHIAPLLPGSQERGLLGGTEPVALAVGFAVAVEHAVTRQAAEAQRLAGLRDRCERALVEAARTAGIEAVVVGEGAARVPHISVVALPGRNRQATVIAADLAGICLASGTACSSGSSEPSPALVAAGLPASLIDSAIRLSLGWSTTAEDIDRAIQAFQTHLFCRRA